MMKTFRVLSILTAVLLILAVSAQADTLTLPADLTVIKEEAFRGDTSLDTVVLPEGIETIGSNAFADSTVTEINLPASLTDIADTAFDHADGLQTVTADPGTYAWNWAVAHGYIEAGETPVERFTYTIAEGACTITKYTGSDTFVRIPPVIEGAPVTAIGERAFSYKSELTGVVLPDTVKDIGHAAFEGCRNITSLTLPEGLETIGVSAFNGLANLTGITIPASVTSIRGGAFGGCTALTAYTVAEGNGAYKAVDGVLFDKSGQILIAYPAGKSGSTFTIPETVRTIGQNAFERCLNLSHMTVPEGVTTIEFGAFTFCQNMTSVSIPASVLSIGESVFQRCDVLEEILVAEGNQRYRSDEGVLIDNTAHQLMCYPSRRAGTVYQVPEDVTSLATQAFMYAKNLTGVTLPETLTEIPNTAFSSCTSLADITIPETVEIIRLDAFAQCNSLTSVVIPASVKVIDMYAFERCENLISVTILGGDIEYLGTGIFYRHNENLVIYGVAGSAVETYASSNGIAFEALPDV